MNADDISRIIRAPNETAGFRDMVLDAQHDAHIHLPHELEGHLVFLLLRFLRGGKRLSGAVALHYLDATDKCGSARIDALSDTGDACLLLAGMFPEQARKRMVNAGYFAQIGRSCYYFLATKLLPANAELYHQLCDGFGEMLAVLRSLHNYNKTQTANTMLDTYELWQHGNCQTAFTELCEINESIPVRSGQQQYIL